MGSFEGEVTMPTPCSEISADKGMERQEKPGTSLTVLMPHPLLPLETVQGGGAGSGGGWWPMGAHRLDLNPRWAGGCVYSNILVSLPPGTQ